MYAIRSYYAGIARLNGQDSLHLVIHRLKAPKATSGDSRNLLWHVAKIPPQNYRVGQAAMNSIYHFFDVRLGSYITGGTQATNSDTDKMPSTGPGRGNKSYNFV